MMARLITTEVVAATVSEMRTARSIATRLGSPARSPSESGPPDGEEEVAVLGPRVRRGEGRGG